MIDRKEVIDWKFLFVLFMNAGFSGKRISENTGVSENIILNMRAGKVAEPKFSTGMQLLLYAKEVIEPEKLKRIKLI